MESLFEEALTEESLAGEDLMEEDLTEEDLTEEDRMGEALAEYVSSLIEQLNLQEDDIIKLIEALEADEDSPKQSGRNAAFPFSTLVNVLSYPGNPMPEYLTKDERALAVYTKEQMDLIVALIQVRYWYAEVSRLSEHFWSWGSIFSVSRQAHREANDVVVENVEALMYEGSPNDWVNLLPTEPLACAGPWYDALKGEYFPDGIDDAIPGFMRHYVALRDGLIALRDTMDEMRKKWLRVEPWWRRPTSKDLTGLVGECLKLHDVEPLLASNMDLARKWFRESANRLERAQLPGDIFGLRYGDYVTVDYFLNKVFEKVVNENGSLAWKEGSSKFNPIRMRPTRPGSPWCDWFSNQIGPNLKTPLIGGIFPVPVQRHSPEHIEIRIPHPVLCIARYFNGVFDLERTKLAPDPDELPAEEPTPEQRERRARAISDATGEPYWRVRSFNNSIQTRILDYADNPALAYRPIYDGAGNIRLDYMDAILHEIKYGAPPPDYRSVYVMTVLQTGSEPAAWDSSSGDSSSDSSSSTPSSPAE